MKRIFLAVGVLIFGVVAGRAAAPVVNKVNKVNFTAHVATRNIGYFDAGESVVMTALVEAEHEDGGGVHTLKFRPRVDGVTIYAAWHISTASSPVRLVGVNIDLLDASGALVMSDTFLGTLGGLAHSTIEVNGLDPNQIYRLVLTGTRTTTAAYSLVMEEKPAP